MSATRWRRAWKLAMNTPNCLRWFMYSTVIASVLSITPTAFGAGGGNAGVHGQFQRSQAVGGDERGGALTRCTSARAAAVLRDVALGGHATRSTLDQEQGDLAVQLCGHDEGIRLVTRRHYAF